MQFRSASYLHSVSVAAGVLLVVGGGLVITGWLFDVQWLRSVSPGRVVMKANTAACFILSGVALLCLGKEPIGRRIQLAGRICAGVVAAVALLTLGEHLLAVDLGIDQALVAQPLTSMDSASPGRMSAATAFNFVLIAVALLGLDFQTRGGHRPALALVPVTTISGLIVMAGYLYGAEALYAFSPLGAMSLATAVLLFVASAGILCARPGRGPLAILTGHGIGSHMARRILPLAVVLPFLMGFLRLLGERAGFYGLEVGLVIFAASNVVVFAGLVWLTAISMNRGDAERVKAETELRRSAASLANAQRIANMGSWDWDVQADSLLWSEHIYRIFGIDRKDFAGNRQAYVTRVHPQDRARVETTLEATLQGGTDFDIEHRIVLPDGSEKVLHVLGDLTRDSQGAPLRLSGTALDITERKRAEEGLLRFRMAMESSLDGIFLMDFETFRYLDANETGCRMLGYTREELLGMRTMDTNPGLTEAEQRHKFEEAKALGSDRMAIDPDPRFLQRKDGTTFPIEVGRRYLRAGDREIVVGMARDITQRLAAEQALQRSEEQYRHMVNLSPDAVTIHQDGVWVFANPAAARLLGVETPAQLVGRSLLDFMDPDIHDQARARWKQLYEAKQAVPPAELKMTRLDGSVVYLETQASPLVWEGRPAAQVVARDVTERKQAEEALRASEAQLRSFVEQAPASLAMFDRDMICLAASRRWVADYGRGHDNLVGLNHYDVHPDIPEAWREVHRKGLAGETVSSDNDEWTQADGTRKWLRWAVQPWRDGHGEIGGIIQLAEDITHRREAEEEIRRLNADLEQRVARRTAELHAKNKELETFSYSVSHDLKAPLRGIDGYSRLLLMDYEASLDEQGRGFLRNIRSAASQMQQLIDDLLAYSKLEQRALNVNRIDLRKLVESILKERAHDLEPVRLSVDLCLEPVLADREGLSIVLRNLVDNAVKFSRRREPPTVEINSRLDGGRHILSVRDNGTGFDMKYHDRIFQIFQRLHRAEDYSGTGVGLAIVLKAAERMGGRVWAESEPDKGATFYLDLPRDTAGTGTLIDNPP